ncbi:exonuclease [Yersinia phage vB_YenM_56.17]|uniref:Exonuclease n=2 Tax=root TaxID=1 RepID=A0AAE9FLF5_9CAUD|nr:exonuclease [Yersinia phage vB_YenM_56.17]UNA05906.1 exonuclease [Yersinia phage vB_YenM_56.17]CNJ62223.1 Uncharacterised protein [Yersinia enterocolitica]CQG97060.1 Uncharacterised protein [Yersinia mollaretii]
MGRKAPTPPPYNPGDIVKRPAPPPQPPQKCETKRVIIMETQTNQKITAQLAVDILNQALSLDPDCITALVSHRIECNATLAHDSEVACGMSKGKYMTGALGIINSLVKDGVVAAQFTDDNKLAAFQVYK